MQFKVSFQVRALEKSDRGEGREVRGETESCFPFVLFCFVFCFFCCFFSGCWWGEPLGRLQLSSVPAIGDRGRRTVGNDPELSKLPSFQPGVCQNIALLASAAASKSTF